jgi:hypothetical protein
MNTYKRMEIYKIRGSHGGDYEELRLLVHKSPVDTLQAAHNFPATETSRLMLCKIWGFSGGDYE